MTENPGSAKEYLLAHSEEYRRLDAQHRDHEARLKVLSEKAVLDDAEQVEETTLKKKKLHLRDRMEEIARQARAAVPQ
jgi:uncharacterized protein YdcH (DUF465 family)